MKREYKVIMLLILVISIVALVLTSSYALFSFEEKGKIENKLVTGVYSSCEYEDGTIWNFDYTGSEQTFTVPCDGEYKLETWGAQGGMAVPYDSSYSTYIGGYGGYSNGSIRFYKGQKDYINVGGQGKTLLEKGGTISGGYNGGGKATGSDGYATISESFGSGGGATHISTFSGQLSTLSNMRSSILIVSGGGGGGDYYNNADKYISRGTGGTGGGINGMGSTDIFRLADGKVNGDRVPFSAVGGTQTGSVSLESSSLNGSFGQGGNSYAGGGGGFYGGTSGWFGGGGGSGYIGNSLLTDKAMCCYNCTESAEVPTKTVSTTCTNQTPTENCSKQGNGYARITLVKSIERYKETVLNGTDPVLKDNLVPVTIAEDGTVTKADISNKWYSYANKEWANAVILKDESITYNNGDTIPEDNIESYFVWIPRYKYQIFDEGNYTSLTSIQDKTQTINVVFESKDTTPSNGTTKNSWLTHPAFTSFDSNGFWVGKFETGYDGATSTSIAQVNSVNTSKIIIKPNVYSWRNITVGNAFKNNYDYQRNLDSHMMKNTEWGAVAYLQHSVYGSQASVRINNNKAFITGYAATVEPTKGYSSSSIDGNRYESTSLGIGGSYTINYLNNDANVASTTGNRSGIYDMSGGSWEYVMGYTTGASTVGGSSGITGLYSNFFTDSTYTKYWNKYTSTSSKNYSSRILGDATGEMGPFGYEMDMDNHSRSKSSWYKDYADNVYSDIPWFIRGGNWSHGISAGIFAFNYHTGAVATFLSYRIVLTPSK